MATVVKIHRKGQMTLPSRLRAAVGVAEGDLVEASIQRGRIVLTPMLVIDRSRFPTADDEYTPTQRKTVDRGIAKSLREYKQGKSRGPFDDIEQLLGALRQPARPKAKANKRRAA